jgi:DNA-binding response OmpR family regulator
LRILVVEDEPALADALRRGLVEERYAVEVARDGDEALWAANGGGFDLIVLDLLLPGLPGLEVCRRLRRAGNRVPILVLTAMDSTEDVVAGLDAGANDYMTKPFAFRELLARIRAATRPRAAEGAVLRVGALSVDTAARAASVDGVPLPLTSKEFQLLETLAAHPGTATSRDRLASAIWAHDDAPDSNALEVYAANLRRKIGRGRGRPVLAAIRGFGYVLRADGDG